MVGAPQQKRQHIEQLHQHILDSPRTFVCASLSTINKLMQDLKRQQNKKHKGRQTRNTIHMAIRDIYEARSTDMLDLSCCATDDFIALLATIARACAFAASNSWTSSTKYLFSRMNIMRSTLLARMLLQRLPMRWASAQKKCSARQVLETWFVMPNVSVPLLLPSDGVYWMESTL